MSLPTERMSDFTEHAWCNTLLADPSIIKRETRTYLGLPETENTSKAVSNTFFKHTLFTDGAVRAFCAMYRPGGGSGSSNTKAAMELATRDVFAGDTEAPSPAPSKSSTLKSKGEKQPGPEAPVAEALILVSLGSLVDGGIHRLHGGVTATLLDHTMGTLLSFHFANTSATSELRVKYLKPVHTPCVVLCRARMESVQGRWVRTRGWLESGDGTVLAESDGAFVLSRGVL